MAQDAEVPGDNFSLEGALELFKKSESPEEFEKLLNAQDSKVNNLDLNGDGYIDYIRVIDRNDGNVHTFTMQAVISDREVQDVAVIALEKKANGKAVLQIIGDEDVYGMETIIEPTQEVRVNAGTTTTTTYVNVWAWPAVQYVYSPSYVVWVSPWSWSVRPVWWYGWHPVVYYRYDSWWRPYRPYYARCYSPRIAYAHRIYRPYRTTSVIVHRRHESQITRYRTANRSEYERSRNRSNNDRYANNVRPRSGQSTGVRTRSNEESNRNREVRETRPTGRNTERSNNAVQRERRSNEQQRTVDPQTERSRERSIERNTREQQREVSRPADRERMTMNQPRQQQPQRERVSGNQGGRSSQPRMSGGDRGGSRSSGGNSGSRSSSDRGGNRRSR